MFHKLLQVLTSHYILYMYLALPKLALVFDKSRIFTTIFSVFSFKNFAYFVKDYWKFQFIGPVYLFTPILLKITNKESKLLSLVLKIYLKILLFSDTEASTDKNDIFIMWCIFTFLLIRNQFFMTKINQEADMKIKIGY